MGHAERWAPVFLTLAKVSGALLAYGLFSWELQLGCETDVSYCVSHRNQ